LVRGQDGHGGGLAVATDPASTHPEHLWLWHEPLDSLSAHRVPDSAGFVPSSVGLTVSGERVAVVWVQPGPAVDEAILRLWWVGEDGAVTLDRASGAGVADTLQHPISLAVAAPTNGPLAFAWRVLTEPDPGLGLRAFPALDAGTCLPDLAAEVRLGGEGHPTRVLPAAAWREIWTEPPVEPAPPWSAALLAVPRADGDTVFAWVDRERILAASLYDPHPHVLHDNETAPSRYGFGGFGPELHVEGGVGRLAFSELSWWVTGSCAPRSLRAAPPACEPSR
jgi:hypothetical protein